MTSLTDTRRARLRAVRPAMTPPEKAHQRTGQFLARMVREADARVPDDRRVRRTLQEMPPGYDRQPVLVLHRPTMANDACPLCLRWNCGGSDCPPSSAAPAAAPTAESGDGQCNQCGNWYPNWNGGVCPDCS
ncbi:hypothetical protein AB0D37_43230 [Streptomyces sp. NPDC048384]|uniref:hypothetical protein n=1 Tax=Streptomyces sp. NPDC048384 TaxID=3155487 RepID=UPI0034313586